MRTRTGLPPPVEQKRLIFVLSEVVILLGEEAPRITLDSTRTWYTFNLLSEGLPPVGMKGKKFARKAFFEDKFQDEDKRYDYFYQDLKKYWNYLGDDKQKKYLEQCKKRLGSWIPG